MYGYVYLTTNLVNGKKYIGKKTSNKFLGEKYLGSGVVLNRAVNKYGKDNFKVDMLYAAETEEDLNRAEFEYIKNADAPNSEDYYNVADGGKGGNTLRGFTEEQMNEFRHKVHGPNHPSWSGKNNPKYGTHNIPTEETRQKQIEVHKHIPHDHFKGHKHSEKSRKQISETLKRTNHNSEYKGGTMVTNGIVTRRARRDEIQSYLDNGFKIGWDDKTLEKRKQAKINANN